MIIPNKGNCGPHHIVSDLAAALRASAAPDGMMGEPLVEINDLRQFQYDTSVGSPLRRLFANAADEIERLTLLLRTALPSDSRKAEPVAWRDALKDAREFIGLHWHTRGADAICARIGALLAITPATEGGGREALIEEIATEAERYAGHYPQSSDGRNTFIMFASFVRALSPSPSPSVGTPARPSTGTIGHSAPDARLVSWKR